MCVCVFVDYISILVKYDRKVNFYVINVVNGNKSVIIEGFGYLMNSFAVQLRFINSKMHGPGSAIRERERGKRVHTQATI